MRRLISSLTLLLLFSFSFCNAGPQIDRKALVSRHNVHAAGFDSLSSLTVGNGEFAYTVDATGMQTFPEYYEKGIPLGTQSQWAWHSFPNTQKYSFEETLRSCDLNGKQVTFPVQWKEPGRKKEAADYFRQNPHRLHLGIIGLEMTDRNGKPVKIGSVKKIKQTLDLWKGEIISRFEVEGSKVEVITVCHPELDQVSFRITAGLIKSGKLKICFRFPYPTGGHTDSACDWTKPQLHHTIFAKTSNGVKFQRTLDSEQYYVNVDWKGGAEFSKKQSHYYILSPSAKNSEFEFSCLFKKDKNYRPLPGFKETAAHSEDYWQKFWTRGGAVDFSGSTDPRAAELERRIILSQYLTAVQCSGSMPPQETGLTCNSWFGKFHLEMHWWHAVHFALWNRIDLLEKSLSWYNKIFTKAQATAKRQGYSGVRWPKMTDPDGNESPSSVGPFLIWQQPHFIYFAELVYRDKPDIKTLDKYRKLVFATADFMASFASYDKQNKRYILGPGIIAAQERFDAEKTFNTPLELAYWHWALETALKWCDRLKIMRNPEWEKVLNKFSPLPQKDGLYLAAESAQDSYTNPKLMTDHPSVLGAYGMINGSGYADTAVIKNTFDFIWENWNWEETWGWDFPLTAMTATRLRDPEKAIDALFMNERTNTYLVNGHNYQDERLRLYLPGNGGLLTAVAMMCAGFDGNTAENPGIPKNGKWKVKWENLRPVF